MEKWIKDKLSRFLDCVVDKKVMKAILAIKDEEEFDNYFSNLLSKDNEDHQLFLLNCRRLLLSGKHSRSANWDKPQLAQKIPAPLILPSGSKKRNKYSNLYTNDGKAAPDKILLKGRRTCPCQATEHKLINNCLRCGRIVCEQEGSGPCLFCNHPVYSQEEEQRMLKEASKAQKTTGKSPKEQGKKQPQQQQQQQKKDQQQQNQQPQENQQEQQKEQPQEKPEPKQQKQQPQEKQQQPQKQQPQEKQQSKQQKQKQQPQEKQQSKQQKQKQQPQENQQSKQQKQKQQPQEKQQPKQQKQKQQPQEKQQPKQQKQKQQPQEKQRSNSKSQSDEDENLKKAIAQRDRLLEYDRNSEKRTTVIDDELDYFQENSVWLTEAEREKYEGIKKEMHDMKHGSRIKRKIKVDFAGREIQDEPISKEYEEGVLREVANIGKAPSAAYSHVVQCGHSNVAQPIYKPTGDKSIQQSQFPTDRLERTYKRVQDQQLLEMQDMRQCLSMHQPWASLLMAGIKKHEGRVWYSEHRGRLWIASTAKEPRKDDIEDMEQFYRTLYNDPDLPFPDRYPTSCLLGCVQLENCLPQEEYRDYFKNGESDSPYVFICSRPEQLPILIPVQGQPKIFELPVKTHNTACKIFLRARSATKT